MKKVPFMAYCTFKHNISFHINIPKSNRHLEREHKLFKQQVKCKRCFVTHFFYVLCTAVI